MNKSQTFFIAGALTDLNTYVSAERSTKYAAAKIKQGETERCAWEIKRQKIKPMQKIDSMMFTWYEENNRKDTDNVEFAQKFIRDGLVQAGVIPNDGRKYTGTTTVHYHHISKRVGVEVTLLVNGKAG